MKYIFLVAIVFIPSFTMAGVFKCTGENGKIIYQTSPCADEKNATEFNVTAGSHTKQSEAKQKSAMDLQRQQWEEQKKILAQSKLRQQQEQLKEDALL